GSGDTARNLLSPNQLRRRNSHKADQKQAPQSGHPTVSVNHFIKTSSICLGSHHLVGGSPHLIPTFLPPVQTYAMNLIIRLTRRDRTSNQYELIGFVRWGGLASPMSASRTWGWGLLCRPGA